MFAAVGVPQGDVEFSLQDEKELVGVDMAVPDKFALDLGDADVIVVDAGDDARTPLGIEGGQGMLEADGGCGHGCNSRPIGDVA